MIRIKRTYEPPARGDGRRILVERLWPRGMKKESLEADAWMKEVAPSTGLRKWFGWSAGKSSGSDIGLNWTRTPPSGNRSSMKQNAVP